MKKNPYFRSEIKVKPTLRAKRIFASFRKCVTAQKKKKERKKMSD